MEDVNNCGHKMCNCSISGDDKYCSDHCREATDQSMPEIACDCGHGNCG